MEFSKVFLERKSVRSYLDRPVPGDLKDKVLAAMLRAPTAGAMMLYSVLEIDDQAVKDRLAVTCDHQPFIARAPWVLVFLADYARMMGHFEASGVPERCAREGRPFLAPRESDLLLACCDALVAAQTVVVAAESLGLGSCYIGDIMENWETHRELLRLPRYTFPIAMLCLGWPTPQQAARPQPARLARDIVVMKDNYRIPSREESAALYSGPGYERFAPTPAADNSGQALYARKFSAGFTLEMRRSVAEMLKEWREE